MERLKRYSVFPDELYSEDKHEACENVCKSEDVEVLEKEVERLLEMEEYVKKVFDSMLKTIDGSLEKTNG